MNSRTSTCKVLHENGSVLLSIFVCSNLLLTFFNLWYSYDFVRPYQLFESKFLPAKIWAKNPFTVRMFLVISVEEKKILTWTAPK